MDVQSGRRPASYGGAPGQGGSSGPRPAETHETRRSWSTAGGSSARGARPTCSVSTPPPPAPPASIEARTEGTRVGESLIPGLDPRRSYAEVVRGLRGDGERGHGGDAADCQADEAALPQRQAMAFGRRLRRSLRAAGVLQAAEIWTSPLVVRRHVRRQSQPNCLPEPVPRAHAGGQPKGCEHNHI